MLQCPADDSFQLIETDCMLQKHSIFGRVCSGMSTVQRLGNIQTGESLWRQSSSLPLLHNDAARKGFREKANEV